MKKFILAVAFLSAGVSLADGAESYLYWMLDTSSSGAGAFEYTGVKVKAIEDSTGDASYLTIGWNNDGAFSALSDGDYLLNYDNAKMERAGGLYASLGACGSEGFSYVIELFNDGVIGVSESLAWSEGLANDYIEIVTGNPKLPTVAWTPQSMAVPEPNSALLMVLGCAALALRRRKMIKG